MKKPIKMLPKLSLAVQYATPAPELPRWRLRRWVQHAVQGVFTSTNDPVTENLADVNSVHVTLRLVDAQEGQELNQGFRQRDYATNILTFEYGADPSGTLHADLVLCVPVLQREAQEQNKALLSHAAHLTIHGTLHALGYDHIDTDDALHMEALETRLLDQLGISDPYLT